MNHKTTFLLIFISMLPIRVISQIDTTPKGNQLEQTIESIAEYDDANIDNSIQLEHLTKYMEHPVNLNTATAKELEQLNMLDNTQIQNILNFRQKYGSFSTIYELSVIPGLNPEVIKSLSPFVSFTTPYDSLYAKGQKIFQRAMIRVRNTLPLSQGYSATAPDKPAAYPGLPLSITTRYDFEIAGKLAIGVLSDQDAGEEMFSKNNKTGFDHYSGYITWKGYKVVEQVTLGDYRLQFGQGVNYGAGSGMGKSTNVLGIMKSSQGVIPAVSSDENQYLRGVSTTLHHGKVSMMLFYSNKKRDANLYDDPLTGEKYFTSFQTSGYHRTISEMEDEKSVKEQIGGGYAEVRSDRLRVGGLWAFQHFDPPMNTGTLPYKTKSFVGYNNYNYGIDYQLALSKVQLFGELGRCKSGDFGGVQGLIWHATPIISYSVYYRHFDPGFTAFYGSSLTENSGNRNESGLYTGVMINPLPKIQISGYFDLYHFPWLTYSTDSPGNGNDLMGLIQWTPSRKLTLYMKGKFESKPQKVDDTVGIPSDLYEKNSSIRSHAEIIINNTWTLRYRLEYTYYTLEEIKENGFLAYQDIVYTPQSNLTVWFRYAYFHTEGYNSRIYSYENDLLYTFSIPEFHGIGHRIYLNIKWHPTTMITTYLKAGLTLHQGISSWGAGNDATSGNARTELRALLYLRF